MSMVKVITAGSQDLHGPAIQMIKMSRRGLIGNDLRDFIKRAGVQLADLFSTVKMAKDEIPIHMLAVGATEDYGSNRNGDGFNRHTCEHQHHTFHKFARFYRDHCNKDTAKSYGTVKLSAYNNDMKRIELICGLNATKEAAERNKGLVATREINKLERGEDIPVSMACKVAYDVCSGCGHKAANRSEYCDETTCKYGGLRNNIGQVMGDGHVLHADNPYASFFDISHVLRNADRIAFVTDQFQKAASHGNISGAELAEMLGVTIPAIVMAAEMPPQAAEQFKIAMQLADIETNLMKTAAAHRGYGMAFTSETAHDVQIPGFDPAANQAMAKLASALKALADERISLPVEAFIGILTGVTGEKLATTAATVKLALPRVFQRITQGQTGQYTVDNNPFTPAPATSDSMRKWARKQAEAFSLSQNYVQRRQKLATLRQAQLPALRLDDTLVKVATESSAVQELANNYALYKLAFLTALPRDKDFELTQTLCVLQNCC